MAGRVVVNGFPTGVEVSHAIVHGGPYPSLSDGRTTSVGSNAIYRFTRLVCYQNFPDAALPAELQGGEPAGHFPTRERRSPIGLHLEPPHSARTPWCSCMQLLPCLLSNSRHILSAGLLSFPITDFTPSW
jgi:hypothetical protein